MRADHRHELKTNELADWLLHFPEWARENRMTLVAAGAVVVVVLGVYVAKFFRGESATTQYQVQLTRLMDQLARQKSVAAQAPERYLGFMQTAADLKDFADRVGNKRMAALALIKRGEALRAEVHYSTTPISPEDAAKQIDQAEESYNQALQRAGSIPELAAAAQFGLGVCAEELGEFDKAKEIYRTITDNADYIGTVAKAEAANRLVTADEYKSTIIFKPPTPKPVASAPTVKIQPLDANAPVAIPTPNNVTVQPAAPKTTPQSNSVSAPSTTSPVTNPTRPAEVNRPAGAAEPNRTGVSR